MHHLLLAFCLLLTPMVHALVPMPATTAVALHELAALAKQHTDARVLTELSQGKYPTAYIHGRCMVGFLGKMSEAPFAELPNDGSIMIGARKGSLVSFRVDINALEHIHGIVGLEYLELAGKVLPDLDRLVKATRADSVHAGINLPQAYTGQDVLIGITDWGFDYTHPMFMDTSMTLSRVRAAWDQFRQQGPAPSGFAYGTEFATPAALLQAEADTANIYSYATHGTHVAGIAGGGGAGTTYRGIAFEASFLFTTFLVDAASVMDAFVWMQGIAQQDSKRLVVNMSWGLYHMGTLDGTSLISQLIDQMTAEGVVFVTSGGNNGGVNFHIKKPFVGDTLRSRIQFYPYNAHPQMWGQSISMWGEPGEQFSAGFDLLSTSNTVLQQGAWFHSSTQQSYLDSFLVQGTDTVFFNITADAAHPLNGRPHFRLRVKNTNTQLGIALKATALSGTVHFWNVTELSNDVGNWGQAFQSAGAGSTLGDAQYGIGEPACTEGVITVAAYSSEYTSSTGAPLGGAIAAFSSYGPTLDDRKKPDLTAPGVSVASSISSFTDASFTAVTSVQYNGRTYPFARFSGTSMSSPAVAGIAALLLEAAPEMDASEIRAILKATARTDAQTGVIPPGGSARWGMGKVNAYRAVAEALGVVTVPELADGTLDLWPNPTTTEVYLQGPMGDMTWQLTLTDAVGRVLQTSTHAPGALVTLDISQLADGTYLLHTVQGGKRASGKVIKY